MILLYHNVFPDVEYQKRTKSRIAISRSAFERQVLWIKKHFRIVTLDEYVQHLDKGGKTPRNLISITFDDGIRSTFENVHSFLSKYKIPSTMFVTTYHLDSGNLLYFTYFYTLCYESEYPSINVDDRVYPLSKMSERITACFKLSTAARNCGDPIKFAQELQQHYPVQKVNSFLYEGMTSYQVKQAAQAGFMEIGAHTVHHPYLSQLEYPDQLIEISRGKETLETICGKPISFFAFPSGDYNKASLNIMEAVKFKAACAVIPKGLGGQAAFELERIGIYSPSILKLQLKIVLYHLKLRKLGFRFG